MFNIMKVSSFITAVLISCTITYSQSTEETPENLFQQYMMVYQQVQQIQQQALSDENITSMTDAFTTKVEAEMIKKNPDMQPLLDKKNELIAAYDETEKAGDKEQLEKIEAEFRPVAQQLMAAQQEILEQDEFKAEAEKIDMALQKKMEEINPQIQQLISNMNELKSQIESEYDQ